MNVSVLDPMGLYRHTFLAGTGVLRCVGMALPREHVRALLPPGISLGPQRMTAPELHPVTLNFNHFFDAGMTIPSVLPPLTYHELTLGVPYTRVAGREGEGPFFYMPRVLLDDVLATVGGILYWGFAKEPALMRLTEGRFDVRSLGNTPLATLRYRPEGSWRPAWGDRWLAPIRAVMSQPVVSHVPLGLGPVPVCTWFDKRWSEAVYRPMTWTVDAQLPGLSCLDGVRVPWEGWAPTVLESPLGGFELRARWRLSLPVIPARAAGTSHAWERR